MTKKEKFEVIANVFNTAELAIDADVVTEIVEFVQSEIEALDRKAVKAKETSAKKRAEGDALRDTIEGMLGEEALTVNDILERLDDDTLTSAKVVARMTQLVKAGKAAKETVKVEGRKLVGYTKA